MKVALLRLPPTPPISASPSTSLPPKSSPSVALPPPSPVHFPTTTTISAAIFREKVLYLESLGLDLFALAAAHPPRPWPPPIPRLLHRRLPPHLLHVPRPPLPLPLRRLPPPSLTFLLREAGVDARFLRRAVSRRPRLLASDVDRRLHLALFFLRSLGTPTSSPAPSTRSSSPVSTTLRESASTAATPSPCSGGSPSCSAAALGTPSSPKSITSWWKWAGMRELKEFP